MKKYIFTLERDYSILTKIKGRSFKSPWLIIEPSGLITVKSEYAWDGCSPKFIVCDLAIGTPDGLENHKTRKPKTYYASLLHDALYQYKEEHGIARKEADSLLLEIMERDGFCLRGLYYRLVRMFGWMFGGWKS